jgi:hypothetical protein
VFVFPDENGLISVTVPANDPPFLPPGTQILIINATNGDVGSFTVGNDGSLSAQIRGTINDRFLITITSPDGSVTTFERSQFVNPETGETAVGPGGGVVASGDGKVEIRIPEGALEKGARFTLSSFGLADVPAGEDGQPRLPDLGDGVQFGMGLKIESPDEPVFKKEIDLAFAVPEGLGEKPWFHVVRRIAEPGEACLSSRRLTTPSSRRTPPVSPGRSSPRARRSRASATCWDSWGRAAYSRPLLPIGSS